MKVMIGQFITESNANVPMKNEITSYDIAFGDELIEKMQVGDIFENEGVEIIPSIYAVSGSSGVVKKHTFDYIETCFLNTVKEHLHEIDGMYLMLHGASHVEEIGSGEHHILKEIRKIVGSYMPITVACDPHGNLCKEYVESTTAIRSYRESPHSDARDTWRKMAQILCDILKHKQSIHSIYRKLPLILGGEQSVSEDEPVCSINEYMNEIENDSRILSCSWHVGYIRHDTAVAGCGIAVVPATIADQLYAEEVADKLVGYVWSKRHDFHYTGITAKPEDALNMALEFIGKPVVITDSGDNTTSGATGWNTYILHQMLQQKQTAKTALFASICDPKAYKLLEQLEIGQHTHLSLGVGHDKMSQPIKLEVEILSKGDVVRPIGIGSTDICKLFGKCVLVHIDGTSIDVIVSNHSQSYCHDIQFEKVGVNWTEYDIVIVKQGYIFPELKEKSAFYVMSLTDGATPQDTANIPFKQIMRPMFPIDDI